MGPASFRTTGQPQCIGSTTLATELGLVASPRCIALARDSDGETICVTTPLWDKCEDETHTPKSGKLESSGAPENSELEFKGQNTSH
jgi:hypothetical protein